MWRRKLNVKKNILEFQSLAFSGNGIFHVSIDCENFIAVHIAGCRSSKLHISALELEGGQPGPWLYRKFDQKGMSFNKVHKEVAALGRHSASAVFFSCS